MTVQLLLLASFLAWDAGGSPCPELSGGGPPAVVEPAREEAFQLQAHKGATTRCLAAPPSYESLIHRALAHARLGQFADARRSLDAAVVREPSRPEAWIERGGLHFLEKRYAEAVSDFEQALKLRQDDYARDMLASSLFLSGRPVDALASWNLLGKPILGSVDIVGLVRTRDALARSELTLRPGELVDHRKLSASRLRLQELGVYDFVHLRPVPDPTGSAAVEVLLGERHGFAPSPSAFAVGALVDLASQRVRVRYSNIGGHAVSLGGTYRWRQNQPQTLFFLEAAKPLGLPATVRLEAERASQAYLVDERFQGSSRGIALRVRRVLGPGTVAQLGGQWRYRTFSGTRTDAADGPIVSLASRIEHRLVETPQHRVFADLELSRSLPVLGSVVQVPRVEATLRYARALGRRDERAGGGRAVAVRGFFGWVGRQAPIDERFAPGSAPETTLPLRAHPQTEDGVLGANPLGRFALAANFEVYRPLLDRKVVRLGAVAFYDWARISRTTTGLTMSFHDVGAGLRIGVAGAPMVRIDYGYGLGDGRKAISVGLNHAF